MQHRRSKKVIAPGTALHEPSNHYNANTGASGKKSDKLRMILAFIIGGFFFWIMSALFSSTKTTAYVGQLRLEGGGGAQEPALGDTGNDTTEYLWKGTDVFLETAKALKPVTDKVTTHTYQTMYGRFLLPYYHLNPSMKFLEIGLGCDMGYGPGASVAIWRKLLPKAELWEAEFNAECVEKHRNGMLRGINLLTGDQGNVTVLDEWIKTSGGDFDIVVDDGGHQNCQIWHSFQKLWPTVKPGGLYFIEDMQVAKLDQYRGAETDTCKIDLIVPEKLKEKLDDLLYDTSRKSDIEFIFCQSEACVLGKKK